MTFHGCWIQPEEFRNLAPLSVFHREHQPLAEEYRHPESLQNLHMLVRTSVFLRGDEKQVLLRLTADDCYQLRVNGQFAGQGPAPGYYFHYYWNEINVTELVHPGENRLEFDVYYQGLINRVWNSGDLRMGMICDVLADGQCIAASSSSWRYALSSRYVSRRKIGYDTQFLEDYDCRIPLSEFRTSCENRQTDYTFSPEPEPILAFSRREPVLTRQLDETTFFFDFGEELAGCPVLELTGQAGDTVQLFLGEETEDTFLKTRWNMRCGCAYRETITLAEGENRVEQYDYKAFRYATVQLSPGTVLRQFWVRARSAAFDENACLLKTDDPVLAQVFQMCKNTIHWGVQEVFVDCPTREKGQYAGDLTISTASHVWLTGNTHLLKKAIENQMQSAFVDKGLLAVTPGSLMQEIADYSLQFPILVRRHLAFTGDRAFAEKGLAACEAMLESFSPYACEDGLLAQVTGKWNLVDWPDNLRDGYDFPLENPVGPGRHAVLNGFYLIAVKETEALQRLLGHPCQNRFEALAHSFQQAFFCEETGLYTDSETTRHSALHSNILPAFAGIVPKESRETVARFLEEKGLCCGVYMSWFLLKALCRLGRYDGAWKLMTSTGSRSWYNMVREGGTTCFEAWGKDQKWNTSLCHPWATGPVSVLIEDLLGYRPDGSRGEDHTPPWSHTEVLLNWRRTEQKITKENCILQEPSRHNGV